MDYLWLAGVSVALAAFGIKTGVGLCSVLYDGNTSFKGKTAFFSITMLLYFIVFAAGHLLMVNVSLVEHMGIFLNMLKLGMTGHIIIALGLVFWGIKLLSNNSREKKASPLLLILPCPICATAILLMTAMAHNLSTLTPWHTSGLLFVIFSFITLFTLGIFFPFRKKIGKNSTGFLGLSMIGVGLYFILLLFLSPVYPAAKKVYAMALTTQLPLLPEGPGKWVFISLAIFIFMAGMCRVLKKESSQ